MLYEYFWKNTLFITNKFAKGILYILGIKKHNVSFGNNNSENNDFIDSQLKRIKCSFHWRRDEQALELKKNIILVAVISVICVVVACVIAVALVLYEWIGVVVVLLLVIVK